MLIKYEIEIKYQNIVNNHLYCSYCGERILIVDKCFLLQQPNLTLELRHEDCLDENLK